MSLIKSEPLAIVGIGCRYPGGVTSPETFWRMVANRTDAIVDVPADRWDYRKFFDSKDKRPGKTRVKQGGYLQQSLREFDPLFFGISPREAAFTDPQQRILLETTWEAFEDAGLTEERIKGSNTGVFIGAFNLDNLLLQLGRDNLELISASTAASVTMTMLSNRLSYTFDLKGPSVTMDTACSSSMVSTHYACQSLWSGDCEMAIAGGVNVILRPEYMVSMSKGGFLSDHGRCKAFDEDARGYVRGEGAGILVIKTLTRAIEDNDNIYALIRSSGVNQDGRTQNGISFPSSEAQRELIRKVYTDSGIDPLDVGYVEAHGTGTQAGDPIEISSIASVVADKRSVDNPCYVGSIKTNIGHTESAAGVAGIIKASLSVNKGRILPNLHFNKPNPKIDFAGDRIKVPVEEFAWPGDNKPRIASVNSFGYGGTNGHVVLQEFRSDDLSRRTTRSSGDAMDKYLVPLSAKTDNALKKVCENLRDFLQSEQGVEIQLDDLIYSLALRRSALDERLALVVDDKDDLIAKINSFVEGEMAESSVKDQADNKEARRLVFVFTGMGPQWWGMGRELYEKEPVFRDRIDECDELFTALAGWSIKAELLAPETDSNMARTSVAQPGNFLIQAGLLALYESWGIVPSAVVGHSVGEVASAYASGALDLTQAIQVSYHRSQLQQKLAGRGAMLAVGVGGETATEVVSYYDQVSIAAVNSASSVTLAGDAQQLKEIAELFESQGVFNRMLQVEVAYHSHQMDPIEADLRSVLSNINGREEKIPLYSTAKGKRIGGQELDADYWWQNVRRPVSFEAAIKQLISDGYSHFLEVGPHPVTRNFLSECLSNANIHGRVLSSLTRKEPEHQTFLRSLGQLFVSGYSLQWPEQIQNAAFVRLPAYPWQREIYWNESNLSKRFLVGSGEQHPCLTERLMTPEPAWEVDINENYFPFLNDHAIAGRVVFPGAGYIEAGLALQAIHNSRAVPYSLQNLRFHRMLMVDETKTQQMRIAVNSDHQYSVYSRELNGDNWILHAAGYLVDDTLRNRPVPFDLKKAKIECEKIVNLDVLYSTFDQRGLGYGESFRTISEIRVGDNAVLAKISSQVAAGDPSFGSYAIYPPLLDGAFQSLIALTQGENNSPLVPVEVGEITVYAAAQTEFWCYGQIKKSDAASITCDLILVDDQGHPVAELVDLVCHEVASDNEAESDEDIEDCFYHYEWYRSDRQAANDLAAEASGGLVVLANRGFDKTDARLEIITKNCQVLSLSPHIIDLAELETSTSSREEFMRFLRESLKEQMQPGSNRLLYLADDGDELPLAELNSDIVSQPCLTLVAIAQCVNDIQAGPQSFEQNFSVALTVVTCGSQWVLENDTVSCASAAAASIVHAFGNELPVIIPKHIDLPAAPESEEWASMVEELVFGEGSEDVALRGNDRFVKRLAQCELDSGERTISTMIDGDDPASRVILRFDNGDIQLTGIDVSPVPVPEAGQLLINVEKVALSEEINRHRAQGKSISAGMFFTVLGTVLSAGEDVGGVKVGDSVIAVLEGSSVSNRELVSACICVPCNTAVPRDLALDCLPLAMASHILKCAGVCDGQRILIQNAVSPWGMMLVGLARSQGLEVYATAATDSAGYLQSLGAVRVFDNSDLTYVSEIHDLLGSHPFHVVINDRGNGHFTQCFKMLAPGGKLVQLPPPMGQRLNFPQQVSHNYSYTFIDYLRTLRADSNLKMEDIKLALNAMTGDAIEPLPKNRLKASELGHGTPGKVETAAEKFGQWLIEFDREPIEVTRTETVGALDRDGTYLITGGTSGLGLELARWLADEGVNSLALVSRNGSSREEAQVFRSGMADKGIDVRIIDADISDHSAVDRLINENLSGMRPLRGVIHCAMVLDDDLAIKMTPERLDKVMRPKVQGAINLHLATQTLDLKQFISISSISAIIGNVGQTSYVAANAFLDQFAYARRRRGLAATTINLGVLEEVGVVARDAGLADVLEAKGIKGLSTATVKKSVGYILNNNPIQMGLFRINWSGWAKESPKSAASSRFRDLIRQVRANEDVPPALANLLRLLEDQESYHARLAEILSNELAELVKLPVTEIKSDRSISDLGIDSLMSVELSRNLRAKYGLEVSSMELLNGPSLNQMADNFATQLSEKV